MITHLSHVTCELNSRSWNLLRDISFFFFSVFVLSCGDDDVAGPTSVEVYPDDADFITALAEANSIENESYLDGYIVFDENLASGKKRIKEINLYQIRLDKYNWFISEN